MFFKGRKDIPDDSNLFIENIDLNEGTDDNGYDAYGDNRNVYTDTDRYSGSDEKIVIKDDEPRKKVRRRVKKGTKDEVLKRRQQINSASSITIVDGEPKKDVFSLDNHQVNRVFKKKPEKPVREEKEFDIPEVIYEEEPVQRAVETSYAEEVSEDNYSDFRASSKDWRDEEYLGFRGESNDLEDEGPLFSTPVTIVSIVIALAIFVTGAFSTVSYAKLKAKENRQSAIERLVSYEISESDEIAATVESVEEPIEFEETEEEEIRVLSLVLSSVEKDLKIKLVDNEDTLVKDLLWKVLIKDEEDEEVEAQDDDMDGIIHLTDVKAGDYSISLLEDSIPEGFIASYESQVVSVKAKIEYKVIQDIKEEIKTEKEVNAAVEDAQGNQAADVESGPVIVDTVEWCESTRTSNGDSFVEATPDLSKTASNKHENVFLAVINNLKNARRTGFKNAVLATRVMTVAENETEHTHTLGNATNNQDGTHTRWCTVEGCKYVMTDNCDFSNGVCVLCGYEKPKEKEPHSCNLSYELSDADGHNVYCSGENCDKGYPRKESHSFDSNGKCLLCGYEKEDNSSSKNHKHNFLYSSNNNGSHEVKCISDGCDDKYKKSEKCTYEDNKCVDCGFELKVDEDHTHTYSYTSNNNGTHDASCECGMTIKKESCDFSDEVCTKCGYSNKNDYSDDAQLYDASKNALYVQDSDGTYRLAKYSDYKSGNYHTYYRKAEAYLYTGWQTIDGKRYYYKSDNSYVTGEQIIGGVTYHFASDGVLAQNAGTLGIDVSKYQPSINWESVKASGVNYVIIRCGYRGSSTGVLIEDPCFRSHIKGAKSVGLKVGVYFFTTAVNEAEAVEEASMCAYLCSNYGIDYPVFMDCEPSGRAGYNAMSAAQRTEIIKAFCNTIRSAGYTPGVYANKTWLSEKINTGGLSGCRIWLAQYNSDGPTYSGHYDMWQYTSKGKINGINGFVDMNQSYLGY